MTPHIAMPVVACVRGPGKAGLPEPAIVTKVHSETCVDVRLLGEGPSRIEKSLSHSARLRMGSWCRPDELEPRQAASLEKRADIAEVEAQRAEAKARVAREEEAARAKEAEEEASEGEEG